MTDYAIEIDVDENIWHTNTARLMFLHEDDFTPKGIIGQNDSLKLICAIRNGLEKIYRDFEQDPTLAKAFDAVFQNQKYRKKLKRYIKP